MNAAATPLSGQLSGRRAEHPGPTALAQRKRVRRSLYGPDLLATAVEDSCTWYGYLAIVLCRIDGAPREEPTAGGEPVAGR